MLHKCRGHLSQEAEQYRQCASGAPTVGAKQAAIEQADKWEKLISEIDATLRDWG
jgi:hypothetical protein